MRKVLANDGLEESRVFAHVLDNGTIDIVRQDQRFTVVGESFTLIGTNPQGNGKTVLTVVGGKLVEDDIKFKEENKDNGQEKNQENDSGTGDGGTKETPSSDSSGSSGDTKD